MKKVVLFLLFIISPALAQVEDCTKPSCEQMGYSHFSKAKCTPAEALKCPFDYDYIFCDSGVDTPIQELCEAGSILYSDKSCSTDYNSTKTAVGIVADPSRKLAIALTEAEKPWSSSNSDTNYGSVPGLNSTTTVAIALQQFDGKLYTKKILAYNSSYQSAKYCNDMSASGTGFGAGNWYLPALGELQLIYSKKSDLNTALLKVNLTDKIGTGYYASSSEYSDQSPWNLYFNWGTTYIGAMKYHLRFVRCMVSY